MQFWLGDIEVLFPYSFIYPEQYEYMKHLKIALDRGGVGVLEMPTGTGKTISLLAFIMSYQATRGGNRKLVYCSRTVPEIEKVVEEVRRLLAYRIDVYKKEKREPKPGELKPEDYLCLSLSSRKNLCIHPTVASRPIPGENAPIDSNTKFQNASSVDSNCRALTSTWTRSDPDLPKCEWFEGFQSTGTDAFLKGVYSLDDLRELGVKKGWCPYFLARHMATFANLVVFSYQYVLDPKISKLVCSQFDENTIVVFDEAHNIDTVCIDALSISLDSEILKRCADSLEKVEKEAKKLKNEEPERLREEYQRLVDGLEIPTQISDQIYAPVQGADIFDQVAERIPGNLRKVDHFLQYLRRILKFLNENLRSQQPSGVKWVKEFVYQLTKLAQVDLRSLKSTSARLQSLLMTLQITNISQFSDISILCDFASLIGVYDKGFCILIDTEDASQRYIKLCCLDASIAMKPVLKQFRSVILTSGTLSPLEIFPKILDFNPVVSARFKISLHRPSLCPLIVTKGADQVAITSKFDTRKDPAVVRNYGNLLIDMAATVPDGMVCFFPSYMYMEGIVSCWNEMGMLSQLLEHKLLFIETPFAAETSLALENYRKACRSGRGAVLFSVARGKIAEGIDFDHHYGRCVIVFGIPYLYTKNRVLLERLKYLRDQFDIKEGDFLTFDAMRNTAQCVGRILRGKSDYGIMVFADKRYNRADKRNKLPQWITQHLGPSQVNLSTETAVGVAANFLREMAQPTHKGDELGNSLWTLEHVLQYQSRPEPQ